MTNSPDDRANARREWLAPNLSGRWWGASRLTIMVALVFPTSFLAIILFSFVTVFGRRTFEAFNAISALVLVLAVLAVPAAVVLFIGDRMRMPAARRAAAAIADARTASELQAVQARVDAARRALGRVYDHHRGALADEIAPFLKPDRYGRLDEAAVASAFSNFQEGVAQPELVKLGYDVQVIQLAFVADKAQLLRGVVNPT